MCGQYFKVVNESRNEYLEPPGLMKAIERVTDGTAMGLIGYLLLEGPMDGTVLYRAVDDEDRIEQAIEAYLEQEYEREREIFFDLDEGQLQRRVDRRSEPWMDEQDLAKLRAEQLAEMAASIYRDDDFELDPDDRQLERVALSSDQISEALEYAGRWAGDEITMIGDYADRDLYHNADGILTYETPDGEIEEVKKPHPRREEPHEGDMTARVYDELAEPGDTIRIDNEFCTFIGYEEQEWTDITDGVCREFARLVGDERLQEQYEHRRSGVPDAFDVDA
jgi:hypothetical protein